MVGAALGQAQRQPGRGPLRDQGGVPLKKARPEAGDPLAKVAGDCPEARYRTCLITPFVSARLTVRRWPPLTILLGSAIPPQSSCSFMRWAGHARILKTLSRS